MSWRVVYADVEGANPDFSIPKSEEPENAERQLTSEESQGQHALAVEVATNIIVSSWVGNPSKSQFRVEMSGHANPGCEGFGNSLQVSVYSKG